MRNTKWKHTLATRHEHIPQEHCLTFAPDSEKPGIHHHAIHAYLPFSHIIIYRRALINVVISHFTELKSVWMCSISCSLLLQMRDFLLLFSIPTNALAFSDAQSTYYSVCYGAGSVPSAVQPTSQW